MDVCHVLAATAPLDVAEEWDNVGLLIGDEAAPVGGLLLTIDLTEPVLAEATAAGADMVMAYHPPIFRPISRLTSSAAPVALAAARAGVAVYSMHTALDAAVGGTNDVLAGALGVEALRPLVPAGGADDCKVVVFVPAADVGGVSAAAFAAGAGRIGDYTECSFAAAGTGAFRGGAAAHPTVGRPGRAERTAELRLEVIAPRAKAAAVVEAIRAAHSYETPAIDVYRLEPLATGTGLGRIGELARPVTMKTFLARVKRAVGVPRVQVAGPAVGRVRRVAVGAGSCGDLWADAARGRADVFVTGEMRHHDALAAARASLAVVCVGHSHSERLALRAVARRLRRELPGLKIRISRKDRDPFAIV
jgi:dinuclear metal center YbgI/SA1388 family protein